MRDLTIGVEEELLVLDPESFDLVPPPCGVFVEPFKRELSPCQVEVVTGICETASQAVAELTGARERLVESLAGRRLAGLGAHPFATPVGGISPGRRYAAVLDEHQAGARLGGLAAGLHVHVAVAGADRALAVYNALRGLAPLFVALGANAPFFAGIDTGLATVRQKLCDALPRQGVGPRFGSWADLEAYVEWGLRTGAFADPAQLWWECRPNLRLGTIELRAPDAQMSVDDVHAIAALLHASVAGLCDGYDRGEPLDAFATSMIQENRWRAARYGLAGELIDLRQSSMVPACDLLRELIDRARASRLGESAAEGLSLAEARLGRDVPAEERAIVARYGVQGLARWAADATERLPGVRAEAAG